MHANRKPGRCLSSLIGATTALVSLSAAASAQQSQPAPAPVIDQSIGEVVVTAEKRAELLKDVPISVSVVGPEQLSQQNISSLSELSRAVPSLNSGGGLGIRGVATNGFARSSESAVSVVLDGVTLGRADINSLFDLARVEVLSGPQGMLFGKNASAGVINIVTQAPDPSTFEAIGHVDYGNYAYDRDRLTVNIPISSTSALRVSGHYDHSGDYLTDTFTHQTQDNYSFGVRARFLWQPTSNLTINLIGDYEKNGGTGLYPQAYGIVPAGTPLEAALAACGIVASVKNAKNCDEQVSSADDRTKPYGLSAQIDYALPNDYLLTSITANRWETAGPKFYKDPPGSDPDLLNTDVFSTDHVPYRVKIFSQELRLTSPVGHTVEFVAGLYYSNTGTRDEIMQAGTLSPVPSPVVVGRVNFVDIYQSSQAAFGQVSVHATDKLTFTAGARYTDEILKDNTHNLTDFTTPSLLSYGWFEVPSFDLAEVHQKVGTDNFSWRLGAQYAWTPDIMTYVTAARGYKGPAVNDQASPPVVVPIIKPEIPMYYEGGLKGNFLDGNLFATLALFYNKVRDFQTAVFTPPTPANPVPGFSQGNAPYMRSEGVELDLSGHPIDGLNLSGGIIYDDAQYAPNFLVACNALQTPGVGACSVSDTTSPVSQVAGTPKWRAVFDGEYDHEVTADLTGFVQSDLVYQTGTYSSPTADPIADPYSQRDQWLLGGRLGIRTSDGRYSVSIWGRNLLNNSYYTLVADPLASFTGGGPGTYRVAPSPDLHRTYGVSLDAQF